MTVRINKQKINLREKLTEFEDKVNFDEVVRGLGEYTGNVGIGTTNPNVNLTIVGKSAKIRLSNENGDTRAFPGYINQNDNGQAYYYDNLNVNQILLNTAGDSFLNGGNVGIGTTTPGFPLTVHQDTSGNLTSDFVHESNNQPYGIRIRFTAASPDNKINYFLKCQASETPNERMVVWSNGDIETALGNSIGTLSDIRTKDSVVDATPKLSDVMKLRVVNFTRKDDPDKTKLIGFVAQEVEKVFPRFVAAGDNREYDEDGNVVSGFEDVKSVKFDSGFAILTKAIQEQQQIIEDLKSRIETLESK